MTPQGVASSAELCVRAIVSAFEGYGRRFLDITRRAKSRFELRDWHGMQGDARERLDLYDRVIFLIVEEVRELLGARILNRSVWAGMKMAYAKEIHERLDSELAATFFNSVTRRIFATVGVEPAIEFLSPDFQVRASHAVEPVHTTLVRRSNLETLFLDLFEQLPFSTPFEDPRRDARRVAAAVESFTRRDATLPPLDSIELLKSVCYRGKGAYLVARTRHGVRIEPLLIALLHNERGIAADAVLTTQDEVSIVFSFARSYFHVEAPHPRALVTFLKSIMPRKPVAELYIALGFNKHGKTELYADILRHLEASRDRFEVARGDRGMVMIVFTVPSYDIVFKVIRDEAIYPKTTTRGEVMEKYRLVFRHDRAGRLVDAQEFENLSFAAHRFRDELLEELTQASPGSVTFHDGFVHLRHVYVERRLTPLNLFVRESPHSAAREAIVDYGQAVKDMAATNIFPGDLLLKNFGVSRHGRVIFYDYDELCRITDCNFRDLPIAREPEQEWGSEPWFYVGKNDVFPQEFLPFLGLPEDLRKIFLERHGELLGADYWRGVKARHEAGEVLDIFPYRNERRLGTPSG